MRSVIKKLKLLAPPDWFKATQNAGVLWLNTALTFASTGRLAGCSARTRAWLCPISHCAADKEALNKHTKFWRPIVEAIVRALLKAQEADASKKKKGLVFVLCTPASSAFCVC